MTGAFRGRWTLVLGGSAYQTRDASLKTDRRLRPQRVERLARCVTHAQVRILALDPLERRDALGVVQQNDRFHRIDHRGLCLLARELRLTPERRAVEHRM